MSRTANPNPEPRVVKTTRIPARLHAYMKSLASLQFGTLGKMHVTMLRTFLRETPWTRYGLAWRSTRATSDKSDDTGGMRATGWEQVNLSLPSELASEIEIVAEVEGVSVSSIIYTACYWWCWYVYPPRQQVEHRRRRNQIESLAVDLVAEDEGTSWQPSSDEKPDPETVWAVRRSLLGGATRQPGSEKPESTFRKKPEETAEKARSDRSGSLSRRKGTAQKADAEKPASPSRGKPERTTQKAISERSGSPSRKKPVQQPAPEKPKSRPRRKLERPQRKTRR